MSIDVLYEAEVLGRSVSVSSRRTEVAQLERLARQQRAEIVGSMLGDLIGTGVLKLGHGLKQVAYAVEGWRQRQATYAELSALDDRLLADLGIQRSDIGAIAEGSPHRPITGGRVKPAQHLGRAA